MRQDPTTPGRPWTRLIGAFAATIGPTPAEAAQALLPLDTVDPPRRSRG